MEPFRSHTSRTVVIAIDNIDTDQIIPARFLTATTREGFGASLFADWRRDASGNDIPDFPLNRPEAAGAEILVAGENFGCGSSREHAPWALRGHGFRAVVSSSLADIFKNNAVKNGLLPIEVEPDVHAKLLSQPGIELTIDLESNTLRLPDGTVTEFLLDGFARHCLLEGIDQLDFLLRQTEATSNYEASRGI